VYAAVDPVGSPTGVGLDAPPVWFDRCGRRRSPGCSRFKARYAPP